MSALVEDYLGRLREALGAARVDTAANAVVDAREYLESALWERRRERPELDEGQAFEQVVEAFGLPEEVARAYLDAERPLGGFLGWYRRLARFSYAPRQEIRCGRCRRSAPLARSAPLILRRGARAAGRWTLGWCSECRSLRPLRIDRAPR